MKTYKKLFHSLANDQRLHKMSDDEIWKLRKTFLSAFQDLKRVCEKHDITVMLGGGTALGAVRHQGFIPWDDDFDVEMPRKDFEKLKTIFEMELGDNYILSSPNYRSNANNRFPMLLIKDTLCVEVGNSASDESSKIKIDIFIIENIPDNILHRYAKGFWCTCLMFIVSCVETYEKRNNTIFKNYLCKTDEGKSVFNRRVWLGRIFSFFDYQKWVDILDSAFQHKKETRFMGIPSGRKHYFGEIRVRETFMPVSKGVFEGIEVNLPGDPHDYFSRLYGKDYMMLPPVEDRERHYFVELKFKDDF